MERHETEIQRTDVERDDEQSAVIARTMVSVVMAMALMVVLTVVAFSSGGSIIA
jgi:hypothetical protein